MQNHIGVKLKRIFFFRPFEEHNAKIKGEALRGSHKKMADVGH